MNEQLSNASGYESRYRSAEYLPIYPDTQIVRAYQHVLKWELGIDQGKVLDFGCGAGNNPKYFMEQGFTPYGCDSSSTAVERCKAILPDFAENFFLVPPVEPSLLDHIAVGSLDIITSNQVLYYLDDATIKGLVKQFFELLRPGGALVVTMMAYSCWYADHTESKVGDFNKVVIDTARLKATDFINFKHKDELEPLFSPFKKLHIGSYNLGYFRDDEGPTDHWTYIGTRP